jgi:Flp pilus assembly protein TadG
MYRLSGERSSERGAVAAEFALILPLMVLLIFGMLQMGLAYQRSEVISAAAREGARVASLPLATSNVAACQRVTSSLAGTTFDGVPNCSVAGDCFTGSLNVVVTVTAANAITIPFWGTQNVTLTGTGDFRCE